jgi:hypothetical protein
MWRSFGSRLQSGSGVPRPRGQISAPSRACRPSGGVQSSLAELGMASVATSIRQRTPGVRGREGHSPVSVRAFATISVESARRDQRGQPHPWSRRRESNPQPAVYKTQLGDVQDAPKRVYASFLSSSDGYIAPLGSTASRRVHPVGRQLGRQGDGERGAKGEPRHRKARSAARCSDLLGSRPKGAIAPGGHRMRLAVGGTGVLRLAFGALAAAVTYGIAAAVGTVVR